MACPLSARFQVVGIVLISLVFSACSRQPAPAPQPSAEEPVAETAISSDDLASKIKPNGAETTDQAASPPDATGDEVPPMVDRRTAGPEPTTVPGTKFPPGSLQESLENQPAPKSGDETLADLGYKSPAERLLETLTPPPNSTRISKQSPLWIDVRQKRVFVDGYVAQRETFLEMFACDTGTKEHESVLGVAAKSSEVHAALLAIGGQVGKTVRFDPEYVPASGQRIRVWVMWRDEKGQFQVADARNWVRNTETKEALDKDWVFAGSYIWNDPSDGKAYYQADSGEMICVSNFSTALMDLPIASSDSNSALQFEAFTERIPPVGTFVRLMLVPLPDADPAGTDADPAIADDADDSAKEEQRPDETLMQLRAQVFQWHYRGLS